MVHLVLPLLIAGALPFVMTGIAKAGAFTLADNHVPRQWQAQLSGWRQRAYWAHLNAFETFPLFAAAAICAHLGSPQATLTIAASWAYPVLRIGYSALYVADKASARSIVWTLSMAAIVALFIAAL